MVLTAKTWRSRGIGTHLLRRCVETIRSTGAVAGLDATELGRPLYQRLGFADVYTLRRWQLDKAPRAVPAASGIHRQPLGTADIAAVAAYDKPRSAMERGATLAHLQNRAPHLAFVARSGANIVGFALGREGRTAHSIGPIVAENEHIACMLAAEAAAAAKGPVMLDVPERHAGMRRWLEVSGAVSPRGFTRMTLGEAPGLADSARVFASAGPELA
jgi:GNAT superfamily N-acetyltransferase